MKPTVFRDGDRIRSTDGTGYHDRVPDAEIRRHIASDRTEHPYDDFIPFAEAVLAIRAFERARAARLIELHGVAPR